MRSRGGSRERDSKGMGYELVFCFFFWVISCWMFREEKEIVGGIGFGENVNFWFE